MNITEIQEYIRREKPAAAYLGRLEMQAVVAEAESHGWVRPDCYIGNQDLARLEFCGCPIFEVISESHAGFSSHNQLDLRTARAEADAAFDYEQTAPQP